MCACMQRAGRSTQSAKGLCLHRVEETLRDSSPKLRFFITVQQQRMGMYVCSEGRCKCMYAMGAWDQSRNKPLLVTVNQQHGPKVVDHHLQVVME